MNRLASEPRARSVVRENGGVSNEMTNPDPHSSGSHDAVTVRRAPRIGAFLVVGGFLGFLATLILTSLFESDPNVGFSALLAYFSLYGITAGVLVGAIVAVVLDRRSRARVRSAEAEREIVEADSSSDSDELA